MIRVRQVKVPLDDRDNLNKYVAKKLRVSDSLLKEVKIVKESIDARNKPEILLVYEVDVNIDNEAKYLGNDVILTPDETFKFEASGTKHVDNNIVIVGSGPAGLFCGYILAMYGYKPLIIERGKNIDDRVKSVEEFWNNGVLDINSNVQFGLGGAGTFSDGKLNTLTKDKEFIGKKVFEIFVENGAPSEIMYQNKPHIGTDNLRIVINNMYQKMVKMGVTFMFNTRMDDIILDNGVVKGIIINDSDEIKCDALVLAIGHSARDTFKMLYDKKINMEAKPFAVGVRIEHPQSLINNSQYGMEYHPYLKNASYKLTYSTKDKRGVYSFCMCPGGYVVNASSEDGMTCVNGMSNYARESGNANSAIVVTVGPDDFGNGVLDGVKFQRKLESSAYRIGGGLIPVQRYIDFKNNVVSTTKNDFVNKSKGNAKLCNINDILPRYVCNSIKEAIPYFGTKIKGFDMDDAILSAVEARTSSPVKILRNENLVSNIINLYPCGEGAGYAGGITTSAIDGVKVAKEIAKIYSNN